MKVKKINTTAYHPQTNGLTERFNKTICQVLSMYCESNQSDWDEYIPTALFAYRVSSHETTLKSPFEVLYGRSARLPSDLDKNHNLFIKKIDKIWAETKDRITQQGEMKKEKHERDANPNKYSIGDLIRLNQPTTKQGLSPKLRRDIWGGPYVINDIFNNGNIKIVIAGREKIVNINRIKKAESKRNKEAQENNKNQLKSCLRRQQSVKTREKKVVKFANKIETKEIAYEEKNMKAHYNLRPRKRL